MEHIINEIKYIAIHSKIRQKRENLKLTHFNFLMITEGILFLKNH